jgi:hypothetical protein
MDSDSDRLRALLLSWASNVATAGDAVPTPDELDEIALAAAVSPGGSPAKERWRPVLEYLVTQVRLGVTVLPSKIPQRVMDRVGPAGEVPHPTTTSETQPVSPLPRGASERPDDASLELLGRLKAWRTAAARNGDRSAGGLNNTELISMVRVLMSVDMADTATLLKRLPEAARSHVPELRQVVHGSVRSGPPQTAPGPPHGPTETGRGEPHETDPRPGGPRAASDPGARADPVGTTSGSDTTAPITGSENVSRPEAARPGPSRQARPHATGTASTSVTPTSGGFAEYLGDVPNEPEHQVAFDVEESAVRVTWPPLYSTDTVIYRLVASDEFAPWAPEAGRLVAATGEQTAVDLAPQTSILRFVQVWVNVGADEAQAKADQPRLHAAGVVVNRLTQISLRDDEARVIGQWRAPRGATEVRVHRIPAAAVHSVSVATLPRFRILAKYDNLGGFIDDGVRPGEGYVYRLQVVARVGGAEHVAPPTDIGVEIGAALTAVDDLEITVRVDGLMDLSWTEPPVGVVHIYRGAKGPVAGSDHRILGAAALSQAELLPEQRISHPYRPSDDGRTVWSAVSWPGEVTRIWVTPVTMQGDEAIIGTARTAVRVPPVQDLRLVERVTEQVLTFPWPAGATAVHLWRGTAESDGAQVIQGRTLDEVTHERYLRLGGVHLALRPDDGCRIFASAVMFDGGSRILSAPAHVDRATLLVLRYSVDVKRKVFGRVSHAIVKVWAEGAVDGSPPFLCVHNSRRLPLHPQDGTPLPVRPQAAPESEPSTTFKPQDLKNATGAPEWRVDLSVLTAEQLGAVRVFPQLPEDMVPRVAVLDPPVRFLKLGEWRG